MPTLAENIKKIQEEREVARKERLRPLIEITGALRDYRMAQDKAVADEKARLDAEAAKRQEQLDKEARARQTQEDLIKLRGEETRQTAQFKADLEAKKPTKAPTVKLTPEQKAEEKFRQAQRTEELENIETLKGDIDTWKAEIEAARIKNPKTKKVLLTEYELNKAGTKFVAKKKKYSIADAQKKLAEAQTELADLTAPAQVQQQQPVITPQDQQALQFYQANPNHPKAELIKQKLIRKGLLNG